MTANAHEADRRKGERLVANKVQWLGQRGRQQLAEYERLRPQHTLRTYVDVERLWQDEIESQIKMFASMQDLSPGQMPVPEDSVWYPNWRVPEIG